MLQITPPDVRRLLDERRNGDRRLKTALEPWVNPIRVPGHSGQRDSFEHVNEQSRRDTLEMGSPAPRVPSGAGLGINAEFELTVRERRHTNASLLIHPPKRAHFRFSSSP